MCTEVLSTEVGLFHLRRCEALRRNQRCSQSDEHVHFVLGALTGLGQGLEWGV